jgi:hypothetical protein
MIVSRLRHLTYSKHTCELPFEKLHSKAAKREAEIATKKDRQLDVADESIIPKYPIRNPINRSNLILKVGNVVFALFWTLISAHRIT